MTQTSHLESPSLTNLDAVPRVKSTVGEGAAGPLREINDYVTTVSADAAGSTYQLVRLPTNAKVKSVSLEWAAMSGGKVQLGVYYSTSFNDGTQPLLRGTVITVDFFSGDIDLTSAGAKTAYTNANANYPVSKRNQPLWQALGLASDPGGYFDIVATCHTTAITTGALLGGEVTYVE